MRAEALLWRRAVAAGESLAGQQAGPRGFKASPRPKEQRHRAMAVCGHLWPSGQGQGSPTQSRARRIGVTLTLGGRRSSAAARSASPSPPRPSTPSAPGCRSARSASSANRPTRGSGSSGSRRRSSSAPCAPGRELQRRYLEAGGGDWPRPQGDRGRGRRHADGVTHRRFRG